MEVVANQIDSYEGAGPLGSTDRKCPINIEELFTELNDDNSPMGNFRTEYQIKERGKKLGGYTDDFTVNRLDGRCQIHGRYPIW